MADHSVIARDELHESEASEALAFCFDNASPEKSCFVDGLVCFFRYAYYLIRTNFRGHLISRIWNTNISRAIIFAILQKMINLGHLISQKLTKDRLRKPFLY